VRRYRISVTAQLSPMSAVDADRLAVLVGGRVDVLAVDVVRIDVCTGGRSAACAADRALSSINRSLAPAARFTRPPVWVARSTGIRGLRRRTTGRGMIVDDNNGDDGLGGVREPRRPFPSAGSAAAELELPAA
jgi:hypothetical protein